MKHDQRFLWLDMVRGLSAIAVCAGHLRAATLVEYGKIHDTNPFHGLFYFFTGIGHQAVMVFFVLSGLFVGGSILKTGAKFHPGDYAISRLTRLWVVLIPSLVLTLVTDKILTIYAPEVIQGVYSGLSGLNFK